jgi:membrane-bound metal-dependent hydrolase YbcI (DUF457 family)
MCTGHVHALSGAVTGAAAGEFALHLPPAGLAAFAGLTACFATFPDLDSKGSCPARGLGFISKAVAIAIAKLSGGHRHLTHTLLGVVLFTAAAWGVSHWRHGWGKWALAFFLLLAVAAGLRAFRVHSHLADVAAFGAALFMAWTGLYLVLVPLACGLGVVTHLIGDDCTDSGCMLAFPFSDRRFHLLPEPFAWTTGSKPETFIVTPLLFGALGLLAYHAISLH